MAARRYRAIFGAAAASAALLWAASPSVGAWWLAWVALVPAAVAGMARPGGAGLLAMPLALALYLETQLIPDLPFGIAEGQWGDPPVPVMIGDSPVLAVALVGVPLYGLLLCVLPLRADRGAEPAGRTGIAAAILVPAIAFAALEFARANLDPGGLWGTLSLTQAGSAGARPAAIAGPWLLAFLVAAVNYGFALAIARRSARLLALPAATLLIAFAGAALAAGDDRDQPTRVAVIQPGYDTAEDEPAPLRRWQPGSYPEAAIDVIGDLARPTGRAARAGAEIVVWPEATTFVDPAEEPFVAALAGRLARENDVAIVFPHFDHDDSRSAVSIVDRNGALSPPVPKQRAMWFLGEQAADADPEPLTAGDTSVGTLLGVDAQYADIAATLTNQGAELLAAPTHDWQQLATQQRAQAQLLARATGAGIARADWRYGSAIIAPGGEILADAGLAKHRDLLIADLPAAEPTAYSSVGSLFGWIALGALAGLLCLKAVSRAAWPSSRNREPRRA